MAAMDPSNWAVGMCPTCGEIKMMEKGMAKMGNASKCDGCGKPLVWKK